MKHNISHDLSDELAKTATVKAFESYQQRFREYDPQVNWTRDDHADISFSAKGIKLEGAIDLSPKQIQIDMSVPFLFKPFQKKAIDVIDKEIHKWIAKAKNGELDNA